MRGPDGRKLGIELTRITSHPEINLYHKLFGDGAARSGSDLAWSLAGAVAKKGTLLRNTGWRLSDVILVVQIYDSPLWETHRGLEAAILEDYSDFDFAEIWVADHSTLEAFNQVELFGVHPADVAGYYSLHMRRKPFG